MQKCLTRLCFILLILPGFCFSQEVRLDELMDSTLFSGLQLLPGKSGKIDEKATLRRLSFAESRGNQQSINTNATLLAQFYLNQDNPEKALMYAKQAVSAAAKANLRKQHAVNLAQLGAAFYKQKNYSKASENLQQSLSEMQQESLEKGIAPVALLSGKTAVRLKDLLRAEQYFQVSLASYNKSGNQHAMGIVYDHLGQLSLIRDDYNNALNYFNKASASISRSGDKTMNAIVQRDIGLVYFKKGMIERSLEYFNKSLQYNNQLLVLQLKKEAYMKLFTLYSFNKDFNKADQYHEQYRSLKDSLDGIQPTKQLSDEKESIIAMLERKTQEQQLLVNQKELELSAQMTATDIERQNKEKALEQLQQTSEEMEKMAKEKALRERDLALKELQLNRQTGFRNLLIFISVLIGIVTYFIYNRYRINRLNNTRLEKANNELASTLEELRRTQDQLIHSEKLASLGQMTAGIAHEIKNPLNFINNFSEVSIDIMKELKDATSEEEKNEIITDLTQNMEKIAEHSRRADNIVKNMLLHSRKETVEVRLADVNKLIEESYNLAYHSMQARNPDFLCTVQYALAAGLPLIKIQYQEMERVFINILDNAFYAMKKRSEQKQGYEPVITMMSSNDSGYVRITITDNAGGIPPEILKNIFQPFFTTKPAGEGTGLGLSLCYDIVTKTHGGTIEARSEPGNGTMFIIRIPSSV